MLKPLLVCSLGRVAYAEALALQLALLAKRQQGLIGDILLLLEHPPVLTLGTRGDRSHIYRSAAELTADGVEIHEVGRGGDVTYHGPGQLIGYPIMQIEEFPGRIRGFVQAIESALIRLLADEFTLTAEARSGKQTGVWVGDAKIVAIGLGVKQWVTLHGFAFNINTDLSHFDWINPCGLSLPVTSVAALTGRPADFAQTTELAGRYLAEAFGRTYQHVTVDEIR
jgi:lipoyl(octanoyl) transferase